MRRKNLLMVADSERCPDMLYAVRLFVPDPFIYLRLKGRCYVVMSDMEMNRARRVARHCRVLSLSQCQRKLRDQGVRRPSLAQVIRLILKSHGLRSVVVPPQFPLGLANELESIGVNVHLHPGTFLPERETKSAEEIKKISAALIMAEVGLAEGIQALKSAKVGKKKQLIRNNVPLTSEKLRSIIDTAIVQAGGIVRQTIVAGGRQACDPHEHGHGVLHADEPIILDVFPRSQKTGYWGDITRTVVKGRASEEVRRMYHTVEQAQQLAFAQLTPRRPCRQVHESVEAFFAEHDFKTGRVQGRLEGFFHGTGHGLGLQIHEAPRIGSHSTDILRAGHVVTVEPGLYYPQLDSGVRIEDVVHVTRQGPKNLTRFEKVLEI